jgi:hypothetical protein
LPDYVGHVFALYTYRCSVPIRAPIIVAQQRRAAGSTPCRHNCCLSNEDRRRAAMQGPVIIKDERSVSAKEAVESKCVLRAATCNSEQLLSGRNPG